MVDNRLFYDGEGAVATYSDNLCATHYGKNVLRTAILR